MYNYLINKNSNKAKDPKDTSAFGIFTLSFHLHQEEDLTIFLPYGYFSLFVHYNGTKVGHTDKTSNRGTMSKEASCQITDLLCQSDTIELLLYTGEDDLIKKFKKKKNLKSI